MAVLTPRLTAPVFYREAFRRNCPAIRLSREEWEELERLFKVCQDEALQTRGGENVIEKKG